MKADADYWKGFWAGRAIAVRLAALGKEVSDWYLYNEIRLPRLPVVGGCKYAVIEYADVGDTIVRGGELARLICSSEPITYKQGLTSGYNLTGDVRYYGFATHDVVWRLSFSMTAPYPPLNEWVQIGEAHFDESTFVAEQVSACDLIWANHDVIDANYGYVVESASEPIPTT